MLSSNFKDSSFLIIDGIKQSRDTLKTFCMGLECARIDFAHRTSDIINQCENIQYDVLLLGYDLGEGRENGQQVLEELRERSLIGRQCIVIMITGEITQAMVLAALEHKPNEYLAKPYTLANLNSRLDRSLKKVTAMKDIYQAMDEGQHEKVIALCDEKINNNSIYKTECLGIKSRQHLALNNIEVAKAIYLESAQIPNCQWASIGLGKIALSENELYRASEIFEGIISDYPMYMSAYDHLVRAYELQNNTYKAEQTLAKATNLSPRSFQRVKKYAQVCYDNENFESATYAYFKTNDLAKNSIHKSPDNAFGLTKSFLAYSNELPMHQIRRMKPEVFKVLIESGREFGSNEIKIQTGLLAARLHFVVKDMTDGVNTLTRAERLLDKKIDDISNKGLEEIAESLDKLNRKRKSQDLLYLLAQAKQDEEALLTDQTQEVVIYSDAELKIAQQAVDIAISFYRNNQYGRATEELQKALALYPHHIGLKLNLLQVLLVSFEEDKKQNKIFRMAESLINELNSMLPSNKSYQRFNKLKHRYNILK